MRHHGTVDLAIVGGGIGGAAVARDASGRGLSVLLCDKGDLGAGTSSKSTKLVHGAFRHLLSGQVGPVRDARREREILMRTAPQAVWPIRLVIPLEAGFRKRWAWRAKLAGYEFLAPGTLAPARRVDLRQGPNGRVVKPGFESGLSYSECAADDARLVVLNALDAQRRGAIVLPRHAATRASRVADRWELELTTPAGLGSAVSARALVICAGAWGEAVEADLGPRASRRMVRLVKGSHLVVEKFWPGPEGFMLPLGQNRFVTLTPFAERYGLIGTTEEPYSGHPDDVTVEQAEVDDLLSSVNRYMARPLGRAEIRASFASARPLFSVPGAAPSDHLIELEARGSWPPLVWVDGGSLTTSRLTAEKALERLAVFFPAMGRSWTARTPLPGAEKPAADVAQAISAERPWLSAQLRGDYVRRYGSRALELLDGAASMAALGPCFGGRFYAREAAFLRDTEWASEAEDFLTRRTQHGLSLTGTERQGFELWLAAR